MIGIILSLFFVVLLNTLYLIYRVKQTKDYSIFACILPRLYFLVMVVVYFYSGENLNIHFGVLLIFLSDLIINLIRYFGKKYTDKIAYFRAAETLKNLQDKQAFIINNPYFGLFTANITGELEFANEKFIKSTGFSIGENIYTYFPEMKELREEKSVVRFIGSYRNGRKVEICAGRTKNGHETITGVVKEI